MVSFRLYDSKEGKPLANALVSVYDGFDRSFGDPRQTDHTPYHLEDIKTSADGILKLDLARFTDPYNEILLKAGGLYKYLHRKENAIKVCHYKPEGVSLRVIAHYDYDLWRRLVTVSTIDGNQTSEPKEFDVIDVPMD